MDLYIGIFIGLLIIIGQAFVAIIYSKKQQKTEKIKISEEYADDTRDLIILSNDEQKDLLSFRKIHCEDGCPLIIQCLYRFSTFICGFSIFFVIFLPLLLLFELFGGIYSLLKCCKLTDKSRIVRDREYSPIPSRTKLNSLCCGCMRRFMGKMRIYLVINKYKLNSIISQIVGFYQMFEYFAYAAKAWEYFNILSNEFGDYFPLLFGVGVSNRDDVIKFLHDDDIQKKPWFIFPDSASMTKFTIYAMPFLSSNDPKWKLGREITHYWLQGFNLELLKNGNTLFNNACPPKPDNFNIEKDSKYIANCFGCIFYYLATENKMNADDIAAFQSLVFNPIHFFPSWLQFLFGGYYFERKQAAYYYRFRDLFASHWKSSAFQSVLKLYKVKQLNGDNRMNLSETVRLLSFIFCIAGSISPSKMCVTILKRLYSDPNKYVPLWNKSAINFIRETGRLSKSVPAIQIHTKKDLNINIGGNNIILPPNSPLLLCLVSANRDPNIFNNPNQFDCNRDNLGDVVTWNGLEKLINSDSNIKKPPRYCPGHDLSFKLIEYIVNQLKPNMDDDIIVIPDLNFNDKYLDNIYSELDVYTKTILKFIKSAAIKHNNDPPTAFNIGQPQITDANTALIPLIGINIAQNDEDTETESLIKRGFRKIINSKLLRVIDINKEWKSVETAIKFKSAYFQQLPAPNIRYNELLSDKMMSRLAFSSMCCHYTQRVNKNNNNTTPENAEFISDFSALSRFRVKSGYEKYGAIAYFDVNYKIIGIYWCDIGKYILPNTDNWNHVKWVWKSSFFCWVTVIDHLYQTHLLKANLLCTACIEELPPTHSLRVFLKPFIYRTVTINQRAVKSLININGLVDRLWTFDYDELVNIFNFAKENYKFRILPNYVHPTMKNVDDKIFGFNKDVNEFWDIMREYVENYILIYYPSNTDLFNDKYIKSFINRICLQLNIDEIINDKIRFIDILTQLIVTATGIHEHVGQVSDFIMSPLWIGTRLRNKKEICSIQEYSQLLSLTLITGLKSPKLMGDWSHLIKNDKELTLYKKWKDNLNNLANTIDERNKNRIYKTLSFNPRNMECSVSI